MNLEMIRDKVDAAWWRFKLTHPLGRRWSKLSAEERFVFGLVTLNVSCFSILVILSAASNIS